MNYIEETVRNLAGRGRIPFYTSLLYEDSVGSTNDCLKEMAAQGAENGCVLASDRQTAGKGRLGRTWVSPAGENIYFSILLRPAYAPEKASPVTLVMGLSVCQAVREAAGLPAMIKWPNDVVVDGRKVCGILTEMKAVPGRIEYVIIGTGINVHQRDFAPEIADKAVSVDLAAGRRISRGSILAEVLARFAENYETFCETEDLSGLTEAYNDLLINRGRRVRIEDPRGAYEAVSQGICPDGSLSVALPGGEIREIMSGEVSVRGIYGYV